MLQLHDAMKADMDYQQRAEQIVHDFPAGSTWVCYTDQVSHAALAGQHQFEQTFKLSVAKMHDPRTSPLRVLEGLVRAAPRMIRSRGHDNLAGADHTISQYRLSPHSKPSTATKAINSPGRKPPSVARRQSGQ